ncbi:MAG: hypothetical protein CM1200mP16_09580 [Nitrospina sp.]|nr:MAG: hypothetical protein CM1200mP16_09580 [Nitrospina sp.]
MGIAISKMVSNIGGWETIVSTQSILLAFGFSVGIGIFLAFILQQGCKYESHRSIALRVSHFTQSISGYCQAHKNHLF